MKRRRQRRPKGADGGGARQRMVTDEQPLGGVGVAEDATERCCARVLELTRQMLERAEQYDWDGVMERDALRVEQLRRLPEADLDSEGMGSQRAAARLRQALEVGRQVRELMEQERDRLGQASRMDQRRREAGAAYHQVSKAVDRGEDSGGSAR